jgi:Tfp pilus assembly protein PilX
MSVRCEEKGIALVITMFMMAALSALAVSLMFLAQTETASSKNYRTMSQARYAAEAGVHRAANYLMNSYTAPASPFTGYNTTKSPVTCISGCTHTNSTGTCDPTSISNAVSSGCIVLSGISGISSNYPDSTVASGFSAATRGTLAVNSSGSTTNAALGTATYGAAAILMSMRSVVPYGSSTPTVIQNWQIVSDGTVAPSTTAIVEVSASFEREYGAVDTYAIFATGSGCASISMSGNSATNSYDSSTMSATPPTTFTSGGDVGTNGNLDVSQAVSLGGSLSTPRTGVGVCHSGGSVPAVTGNGANATTIANGETNLPQSVSYPTPDAPSPMPPVGSLSVSASAATCTAIRSFNPTLNVLTGCTYNSSTNSLSIITNGSTPLLLPDASIASNLNLTISYGDATGAATTGTAVVNINSINMGSQSVLALGTGTSVTMNVAGKTSSGGDLSTPLDFTAGATINTSYDPSRLQILYAGTGNLNVDGAGNVSALIYAPNAAVKTTGNGNFYGSILSNTFQSGGSTSFHYDSHLQKTMLTLGNYVMLSFSWKKY